MKKFLILTAIFEGLTGIALIAIPNIVVLLLLGKPVAGPEGKITAMIAGTAILSLAVICWIMRETPCLQKLIQGMLFYNIVVAAIALVGIFWFGLTNPGLWFIVLAHAILLAWGVFTLTIKSEH